MRTAALLLLGLLLLPSARAGDEPDREAEEKRIDAELATFRRRFASSDDEQRGAALRGLLDADHERVVREIARRGITDRNAGVREVAAQVLGRMKKNRVAAGRVLKAAIGKNGGHAAVLLAVVRSLARLEYRGARRELTRLALKVYRDEKYRFVVVETVKLFALLRDVRSLPFLLDLAERLEKRAKSEARTESDAGDGGEEKPRKGPDDRVTKYVYPKVRLAVKAIAGVELECSGPFRKWLAAHRKELGLDRPDPGEE